MVKLLAIVALCVLGAALSKAEMSKEEMLQKFMEKSQACLGESGAAPSDIDDMIKKQPAASHEAKCLRACVMKAFHVMDDAGKFSKEGAIEKAKFFTNNDPEKMKIAMEMIDACISQPVSDDKCEAAEEYGKCFKEQAKARGIEKMER